MLWDINIIPNEQDNGYLMLPPGVLHMSALAASDVSPSSHLAFHIPNTCRVLFVLCCVLGLGGLLLCCVFGFLFCKCFGIPNSPRSLDLDDRQGLIASSAMQQKKKDGKPRWRSWDGDYAMGYQRHPGTARQSGATGTSRSAEKPV